MRRASEDDLRRYLGKAINTWGTVEEYKHFIPRIAELATISRGDSWSSINRVDIAGWSTWPDAEREALEAVWRLWLEARLAPPNCTERDALEWDIDHKSPFSFGYGLSDVAPEVFHTAARERFRRAQREALERLWESDLRALAEHVEWHGELLSPQAAAWLGAREAPWRWLDRALREGDPLFERAAIALDKRLQSL